MKRAPKGKSEPYNTKGTVSMSEQNIQLDPVSRLSKDLAKAALSLGIGEVRFLVDYYYSIQEYRKASGNQIKALSKSAEPHAVILWLGGQMDTLEQQIKRALDKWTDGQKLGQWCKSITGLGPVITAGLISNIDITKAPTVGHIWRFAGADPTVTWGKGEKRPWNARLKVLRWKLGESFVKVSNHPDDFYGKLWRERKEREWVKNRAGDFAEQARRQLAEKRIGKDTDAYLWMSGSMTSESLKKWEQTPSAGRVGLVKKLAGQPGCGVEMLCPEHIHLRSTRWAQKLFLSHYQFVAYNLHYGCDPPKPYVISILGHADEIRPPNWPM